MFLQAIKANFFGWFDNNLFIIDGALFLEYTQQQFITVH